MSLRCSTGEYDRKLVKFEMDLYWIPRAHQDPLNISDKYPDVFLGPREGHGKHSENFTEVGRGRIDFKRVFAQAGQSAH